MIKPTIKRYERPCAISDYPVGPSFKAGHLISTNGNYRTFRPVVNFAACIGCLLCYAACPDGAINRHDKKVRVDYDFCKGCGMCARECKVRAITMKKED
jgi:pyruvate ferredoxin oxidoreductase delta subunit